MDFTPELSAFQGSIISADNVHQFSKLSSKGGNEEKIKFVIQHILKFLKSAKYVNEDGIIDTMVPTMRKFAMYIVLNADLPVLEDMMDVTGIEPLIWSIPTVKKHLMCELMWHLYMEPFIYEIIPNCWPQLGLEVAEAFLENFKYFSPTDSLFKLYKLSAACYALICRLACFKFDDDVASNILTTAFETLQKYLKYFTNPPNKHRLDTLRSDEVYKYKGNRLKAMLYLVNDCCNVFTQKVIPNRDDVIYKLTYNEDYLKNTSYKVCESPNKLVLEFVNNSNVFLLDIFKEVVMDVSVDIFCAWSEYEEDGKSVQQVIGELCDKVLKKLESISSIAEHPVVPMIQVMARKPTDINDIINSTDTETIVSKIDKDDGESPAWIHALVNKEGLCQDLQLVNFIKSNMTLFTEEECFKLFMKFHESNIEDTGLVNRIKIGLFNGCNVDDKYKLLKVHFRDKILVNTMIASEDFELELNEMFNKFIADANADFTEVLSVFFQNPQKVYHRIFGLVSQNGELKDSMLKVMTLIKDYTKYCYSTETEPCMIKSLKCVLNNHQEKKYYDNIVKFICILKNAEVISSSQLLMFVIMPNIHNALVTENMKKMYYQVQLLTEAYPIEQVLAEYRAPMLVVMGQVMEMGRLRNLGTFQIHALQTLQIAIQFQKSLMETYSNNIPGTDGSWLRHKIRELNLHPLNFYYFRNLWNVDNRCFFESITEMRVHKNCNLNLLTLQLTQIIPWAILEEWTEIWDDLIRADISEHDTLRLYTSAMELLNRTVEEHRTKSTRACLFYCYNNFMHIIRYKYLKEPLADSQVKNCITSLSQILKISNSQDVTEIETLITPLLAYLAEKKADYTVSIHRHFTDTRYLSILNKFLPETEQAS
ncbi:uncharacterized protein LOC142980799 [Anticarsia gemmatalis]|uniref:uncharacterized protein LOC142980799 n=1 Tax=Anticarsia gemmatalis TaxID=129554 RepID=UPI003F76D7FD